MKFWILDIFVLNIAKTFSTYLSYVLRKYCISFVASISNLLKTDLAEKGLSFSMDYPSMFPRAPKDSLNAGNDFVS